MNRRDFLKLLGLVTTALSTNYTIPTFADALSDRELFISNSMKNFKLEGAEILSSQLAGRLYDRIERSDIQNFKVMTSPVDIINGVTVAAKTRAFRARFSHELISDLEAVMGPTHTKKFQDELLNIVAHELSLDLNREIERMASCGSRTLGLHSVDGCQVVDSQTFVPMIGFKIRYAMV